MSLFTISDAEELISSASFQSIGAYMNLSTVTAAEVLAKMRAAESEVERALRVYLQPVFVLPNDAEQSEIDALEAAGERVVTEAAYDYDPGFFQGDKWGFIVTRQKPIISVQSIDFAYPNPDTLVWQVPISWVRLDKRYGHIRLVPAAQSFSAPLSAFVMQALGGGRTVPFMIRLRYRAGLENIREEWPEIIDLIQRWATLKFLKAAFIPQSGSISADGLSRSVSADLDKFQDGIDKSLGNLRDAIHGVRFGVMG